MDYQKSGIVFFKKNKGKYYFLLAKNNLNILNNNNNFYSDIGGLKQSTDFNSRDTAARSFYENTFGLSYPINELSKKITRSYENRKYKHIIHFIEDDFSSDLISNINSVRSYLNQTVINSDDNMLKKKECSLQGCLVSNGVKWFELSEIISNPDNFDKKFMNTFLKSIKKMFMKTKKSSDNEPSKNEVSKEIQQPIQIQDRKPVERFEQRPITNIPIRKDTDNMSEKVNSQFYPVN
jgi:hypothetical protein